MSTGAATWEGTNVSLGQIDAQLQRLWRAADSAWDGEGRRPDIRTSVLNLIVYAPNDDCRRRASQAMEHLAGTHPSRSIIIVPDREPRGPGRIDAQLAIRSHGAYAEFRQVCSEELVLWVHGEASRHVDSVVLPLLAPDLPVFVWWPGETPFGHHMYQQLADAADRFIVDSSDFAKPAADLVQLGNSARGRASCAFSDFNWARLAPWRESVAQFFDQPRFRGYLERIKGVWIGCAPMRDRAAHDVPQALLLGGWLASALGLHGSDRQISDEHYELGLANGTRRFAVDIRVGCASAEDPVAVRIEAAGEGGDPPAHFVVSLDRASGRVTATASLDGSDPVIRKHSWVERDEGALLFQELEVFGHDRPYEQALLAASSMIDPRYHATPVKGSLVI